jgi:hypothetical protein
VRALEQRPASTTFLNSPHRPSARRRLRACAACAEDVVVVASRGVAGDPAPRPRAGRDRAHARAEGQDAPAAPEGCPGVEDALAGVREVTPSRRASRPPARPRRPRPVWGLRRGAIPARSKPTSRASSRTRVPGLHGAILGCPHREAQSRSARSVLPVVRARPATLLAGCGQVFMKRSRASPVTPETGHPRI